METETILDLIVPYWIKGGWGPGFFRIQAFLQGDDRERVFLLTFTEIETTGFWEPTEEVNPFEYLHPQLATRNFPAMWSKTFDCCYSRYLLENVVVRLRYIFNCLKLNFRRLSYSLEPFATEGSVSFANPTKEQLLRVFDSIADICFESRYPKNQWYLGFEFELESNAQLTITPYSQRLDKS